MSSKYEHQASSTAFRNASLKKLFAEGVGGRIEHFGMPVDAGNLLLIGAAKGHPVIAAPGCARSPKRERVRHWMLMRLPGGGQAANSVKSCFSAAFPARVAADAVS